MPETKERVDYLYEEYTRLHALVDTYAKSSFKDFKLLAVVGSAATLSLKLATPSLTKEYPDEVVHLLFFAFLLILGMIAVIAFRDLIKQSLIAGYAAHMISYENELRGELKMPEFGVASASEPWYTTLYLPLMQSFVAIFGAVVLLLPWAIIGEVELDRGGPVRYAWVYLSIAVVIAVLHTFTTQRLIAWREEHVAQAPGRDPRPVTSASWNELHENAPARK